METKKCIKCQVPKEIGEFYRNGKGSVCKLCEHAQQKAYQKANRETCLKVKRKYNTKNKDVINEKNLARSKSAPANRMLIAARSRAKNKSIPFNLDLSDIVIPEFCPVLGMKLEVSKRGQHACSPSLDRIFPEKGYVKGNVVVISHRANMIKNSGTVEEHEKIVEYIKSYSPTEVA